MMLSHEDYLKEYAKSHQNEFNQMIHFICVPAIFITTVALFWSIPVGAWLGLEGSAAYWVNGGSILTVVCSVFYLLLSLKSLAIAAVWVGVSAVYIAAVESSGLSLVWTSAAIWIVAWGLQFWGHKVEGAKPNFLQDLLFLLIGPLFVTHELSVKFNGGTPISVE